MLIADQKSQVDEERIARPTDEGLDVLQSSGVFVEVAQLNGGERLRVENPRENRRAAASRVGIGRRR